MTQEELEDLIARLIREAAMAAPYDDLMNIGYPATAKVVQMLPDVLIALNNTRAPDDHPNATDYRNRAERAEAELAEVRAEVERLREALRRITEHEPRTPGLRFDDPLQLLNSAIHVALNALNGGKHD